MENQTVSFDQAVASEPYVQPVVDSFAPVNVASGSGISAIGTVSDSGAYASGSGAGTWGAGGTWDGAYAAGGSSGVATTPGGAAPGRSTVSGAGAGPGRTTASKPAGEDDKTVSFFESTLGFEPVTGWLVCIEGIDRGRSYALHSGKNTIGRGAGNDVQVAGDPFVSRDRHGLVAYDPKGRKFFVHPGDSRELLYVGDDVVLAATPLKHKDVLSLGKSKLLFIPFCDESFAWDDLEG